MSSARLMLLFVPLLLTACSRQTESSAQTPPADPTVAVLEQKAPAASPIEAAVNSESRSADDRSRDVWRHPAQSLEFWGLAPGMSILEIQPGAGWWTEILAPYARATGGRYHATAADLNDPKVEDAARKSREDFTARFVARPEIYGDVTLVAFGPNSAPLPANAYDFILTARSVHGWIRRGTAEKLFGEFHAALKPGGILALEQHRANPGKQEIPAESGYVTEAYVIELAQKAGLELVAKSEINANAKDSKDHPFGVWTLPPNLRSRPYSEGPDAKDPAFDSSKYSAIGESDRMTLRFRRPLAGA